MSTSRDNLPAVPEEAKPPTLPAVLWQLAGVVFRREALMGLASVAVLVGAGAVGVVWAQDKLDGGVEHKLAPLEARQSAIEAKVARVEQQVANVERLGLETNLNVRLMLESRGITPITVVAKDGGN